MLIKINILTLCIQSETMIVRYIYVFVLLQKLPFVRIMVLLLALLRTVTGMFDVIYVSF